MKGCTCTSCHMDNIESHHAIDFVLSKRTYIRTVLRDERIIPKSASTTSNTQTSTHKRNNIFLLNKPARCKLFCDSCTRIDISLLWLNNLCRSLYCFLTLLLRHRLFNSIKVFFVLVLLFCPQLVLSFVEANCSNSSQTCEFEWLKHEFDISFCKKPSEFELKCPLHSSNEMDILLMNSTQLTNSTCQEFRKCDNQSRDAFERFQNIMNKYVSPDEYIINLKQSDDKSKAERSCNILQCLHHYKRWVCSYLCTGIIDNVDPMQACYNTERLCPIFRIFSRTKIRGGQPVFLCQGFQGDVWDPRHANVEEAQCSSSSGGSTTVGDSDDRENSTASSSAGGVASAASSSINVLSWSNSQLHRCVINLLALTFFLSW